MSHYDIEAAIDRLRALGVDTADLHQDYYKIPLENIDLAKIEKEAPTKTKVTTKHNIIVDSRQRDYSIYPLPNDYLVNLMEPHRNVEKIELIAAMMPKTEYNVNSDNNLLVVTIGGTTEQLYMNVGQYLIGSNIQGSSNYITNGTVAYSGILAELIRTLNTHTLSANGFNAFLATVPNTNGGTGQNAAVLNRIVITNTQTAFSIDFTNNGYMSDSPYRVLGFQKMVTNSATSSVVIYGDNDNGNCTSAELQNGTTHTVTTNAICSTFDYDLLDDPKYIIMQLSFGNNAADRIESIDIATNQKFAIIIYDANEADSIQTYNSSTSSVQLAVDRRPGRLKALKGSDFDKKILVFDPPITLENFKISFFKYDNTPYNFHNREHLLTFELEVADYDPRYRY